MTDNPYEQNLGKTAANYQPLTPLTLLERAAMVYPDHMAVIHGAQVLTYRDLYARCRRLASALSLRYIGPGDTVSVMLANTPPMLEAHYGVPMTGGVLHSINTRLDAAAIAFQLDHANTKVLITDREFSAVMKEALALAKVKPLVIDYDDKEFPQTGERLSYLEYESVLAKGDPELRLAHAGGRVGGDLAQLHVRHHRQSQGRRLPPPRRGADVLRQRPGHRHDQASGVPVDAADVPLQRLVLPVDGLDGRRHARLPPLGARQGHVRRHRRPPRHAPLRRAHRHVDAARRQAGGTAPDHPPRRVQSRCGPAAAGRPQCHGRGRISISPISTA